MSSLLGQVVRLTFRTFSDADRTVPADPDTITATVIDPAGASAVHNWPGDVVRDALGVFHLDVTPVLPGRHEVYWSSTGLATAYDDVFYMRAAYSQIISLSEVRARLNKTLTVDDDEIQQMLDAALAEYATFIGPLPGPVTEVFDGGGTTLVLSSPTAVITAASYDSGQALAFTDLVVSNGIVRWGYGTAGRFQPGRVSITYTAGTLPANHREVIISDVAGYFEVTQRSSGADQASYPGEEGFAAPYGATPAVLFPRIRELAKSVPSIA